ncbi:MAG TPA: DoxX family membrane protein [bacterium]|nr:DoxX family membrane protein [bacterium]
MVVSRRTVVYDTPAVTSAAFDTTRLAWLWLPIRLYVGWAWLTSGLGKIGNPAWVETGAALRGFWERAATVPEPPGRPAIAFDWYRAFIQWLLEAGAYSWFAKLIVVGEVLIGAMLLLGAFTGIAAFFGAFMNWNFMMAGTASINPLLFTFSILLMLAWKVAGHYGLDRYLLPRLGTPWHPREAFRPAARAGSSMEG